MKSFTIVSTPFQDKACKGSGFLKGLRINEEPFSHLDFGENSLNKPIEIIISPLPAEIAFEGKMITVPPATKQEIAFGVRFDKDSRNILLVQSYYIKIDEQDYLIKLEESAENTVLLLFNLSPKPEKIRVAAVNKKLELVWQPLSESNQVEVIKESREKILLLTEPETIFKVGKEDAPQVEIVYWNGKTINKHINCWNKEEAFKQFIENSPSSSLPPKEETLLSSWKN